MGAQWKTKHKMDAANARGRIFTKLAKEIMVAARNGADPSMNAKLRSAIEAAKKASMPKDTLERAIKKGAGLLDGPVNYETVVYEGFAPHQVPVIVECLTDNKNRSAQSMRILFRKGQLGSSGSVSWDFKHLGQIEAVPTSADADMELAAIEAGAQDFEQGEDGEVIFLTESTDLDAVAKALPEFGYDVHSAKLVYRANNPVSLDDAARAEVEAFLDAIDNDDDVQNVYVGLA
ncbi:YebC/PmpR family DNA-binding transcriptional regulator [Alishewanella sp. HH-ZS]|jgi:YebC/PmpR family DNA-binding regulatory protein|uniref:YebC/PmpR family DNA-binding transcriptional regulator n=1 Tax=Alishewanella sp. HH-ZS TaxID=1856684 RepID=UPI000823666A|nr:YebC/PmpR family DNA-binding transcriptional regulator [Alishewanella sp. HH-ZS]OCW97608.1 transcriptional regulator [Alishewanella sp. HH-ZS]